MPGSDTDPPGPSDPALTGEIIYKVIMLIIKFCTAELSNYYSVLQMGGAISRISHSLLGSSVLLPIDGNIFPQFNDI